MIYMVNKLAFVGRAPDSRIWRSSWLGGLVNGQRSGAAGTAECRFSRDVTEQKKLGLTSKFMPKIERLQLLIELNVLSVFLIRDLLFIAWRLDYYFISD